MLKLTRRESLCVLLVLCIALVMTYSHGFNHDYNVYLIHWQHIITGGNPWVGFSLEQANAYGPMHAAFALFYQMSPYLPKYLFTLLWFGIGLLLMKVAWEQNIPIAIRKKLLWYLLFCPYFWRLTVDRAFNDIVVAASLVIAFYFVSSKRSCWAGLILALGILMKFIPLIILPFLTIRPESLRRRQWYQSFDISLLFSALFLISSVFFFCWLNWGVSVFDPLIFASERPSKILSVFRYLRGEFSFLHLFFRNPNVDFLSLPLLLISLIGLFFLYLWQGRDDQQVYYGFTALLITMLFYKVGHTQFYAPLFFLAPYLRFTSLGQSSYLHIRTALVTLIVWITVQDIMYSVTGGFSHSIGPLFRELGGLVTFLICSWLVVRTLQVRHWPLKSLV